MSEPSHVLVELTDFIWSQLKQGLSDVEPEEINWRPLPQANSINRVYGQ